MTRNVVGPWSPVQEQINRYFPPARHPYRILEHKIEQFLTQNASVLDIGCGRTAPNLLRLKANADRLIGVDLVEFSVADEDIELFNLDVCKMDPIPNESIDLAYSRSVMEHLQFADLAYKEIFRILKNGGVYIFLTPNIYDYAAIISALTPNKYHPAVVKFSEGREEDDTFPTYYRTNSKRRIRRLAEQHGFRVLELEYLGQYPSYLVFNRYLFWLGCMYEKAISSFRGFHFLKGWLFCVLQKTG